MTMTGIFHITLVPDADEQAFVAHMVNAVFSSSLLATRITRSQTNALLKKHGGLRQYAWQATVDLMNDMGRPFDDFLAAVRNSIAAYGEVTGVDTYTHVDATP